VAQLNLYVPDELAERLRQDAAAEGKSLSKYVVDRYLSDFVKAPILGPEFWEEFDKLGPLPDDFVAPSRIETLPERVVSFDDLPA
jgi:hypothetical protein